MHRATGDAPGSHVLGAASTTDGLPHAAVNQTRASPDSSGASTSTVCDTEAAAEAETDDDRVLGSVAAQPTLIAATANSDSVVPIQVSRPADGMLSFLPQKEFRAQAPSTFNGTTTHE